jgi:hypothetical protein
MKMNELNLTEIEYKPSPIRSGKTSSPIRKKPREVIKKFKEYMLLCNNKYSLHIYSAKYYKNIYNIFLICILLSGTANAFIAALNSLNNLKSLAWLVAAITAINTFIIQVFHKLNYSSLHTEHINSANNYISLSRRIEMELFKTEDDEDHPLRLDFETFHKEFSTIESNEPLIPNIVEEKYKPILKV